MHLIAVITSLPEAIKLSITHCALLAKSPNWASNIVRAISLDKENLEYDDDDDDDDDDWNDDHDDDDNNDVDSDEDNNDGVVETWYWECMNIINIFIDESINWLNNSWIYV